MIKGEKNTFLYNNFEEHLIDDLHNLGLQTNTTWFQSQRQTVKRMWIH